MLAQNSITLGQSAMEDLERVEYLDIINDAVSDRDLPFVSAIGKERGVRISRNITDVIRLKLYR